MSQNTAQPVEEPARDVDTEIQMMWSAVARLNGRWGLKATAGVLCGSEAKKLMDAELDEMSVYGLLEDLSQSKVAGMLEVLVRAGLVRRNSKNCLELTLVGKVLMLGERAPSPSLCEAVREAREADYPAYAANSPTLRRTLKMVRRNHSPRDIAERRDLSLSTVTGHLMALARRGEQFDLRPYLDEGFLEQLRSRANDWEPGDALRPIRESFDEEPEWWRLKLHLIGLSREGGSDGSKAP